MSQPEPAVPLPLPFGSDAPALAPQTVPPPSQPSPRAVPDGDAGGSARGESAAEVRVIRSAKRKKTSAARVVNGVIEVRIPSFLNAEREAEVVADLVARIRKSMAVADTPIDLTERARELAVEYDLPEPADIRWVTNQHSLWGSCTSGRGTIRISSRLTRAPQWVVDYVVLHELTHLVEANHGPRFHELMHRYPRYERAEGFLEAMSLGMADPAFLAD